MRVVITGARGFVGPHVAEALQRLQGNNVDIIATSKVGSQHPVLGSVLPLDVRDRTAVAAFIAETQPTHVVHLAGIASPTTASAHADLTWSVNLSGTLNIARAILQDCPDCWLINVGSGLIYGESAKEGLPLDERALLAPTDEYSASKAAADLALGALVRRGLNCIRLRPFNHTGPGQSDDFVVPSFAMQIARIEAGQEQPTIHVGNLDAQRDFLDVRDVATAYSLVVGLAEQIESGTILNIASGVTRRIADIFDGLRKNSFCVISSEQDAARMRPSDLPVIIGDASRARSLLAWSPQFEFDDTLTAVLNDARARVAKSLGNSH